ncbi:peptide deformylase [Streptomyces sp. SPB074]|uniref:peptide deformylase n=1 Tax=Streptomyces sp. (strain SPB074) TaxID=465543 RepID=UPI00055D8ADD|nr:peptide deformylase [Streptomyces sp. SPB074]
MTTPDTPSSLPERVERLLAAGDLLPIVAAGDPVLRTPAAPYEGQLPGPLLARLLAAMRRTMREAPGVGLAAPQIGVPLRLAVLEDPATVPEEVRRMRGREPLPYRVLVNPHYAPAGERRALFYEGCLSVPGWQAVVARHAVVRLRAEDEHGTALDEEVGGWAARIVQHETDHLDGTLYVDRALPRSLTSNENLLRYWNEPSPERAAAGLGFVAE